MTRHGQRSCHGQFLKFRSLTLSPTSQPLLLSSRNFEYVAKKPFKCSSLNDFQFSFCNIISYANLSNGTSVSLVLPSDSHRFALRIYKRISNYPTYQTHRQPSCRLLLVPNYFFLPVLQTNIIRTL